MQILSALGSGPFSGPLIAFATLLTYVAAPLASIALIISAFKYQKDKIFEQGMTATEEERFKERQRSRRQFVMTFVAALILILVPFLINLWFWIVTGEPIGFG